MPVCSKCGAELDEAAKFCMECGTPVSQNKKCVKCGAELPNNAKFCFSCGAPQDVAAPAVEKAEPKNSTDESSSAKENIVDNNKSSDTEETFTDPRDGEVYRTCKIGNQIWMAENLRYRPPKGGSYPYDKNKDNVAKYGRLYEWECVKEAVPPGWHLPSEEEIEEMMAFIGKIYNVSDALRSEDWDDGMDVYGFNAIPSGYKGYERNDFESESQWFDADIGFYELNEGVYYWTKNKQIFYNLSYADENHKVDFFGDGKFRSTDIYKYNACSIRCIKDAPIECDFCKKIFNAEKNPIMTFEHVYVDGNPIQKKDIIKKVCYGCQNTIGRDFISEQKRLKQIYEMQ